jgi:hypothetical protein
MDNSVSITSGAAQISVGGLQINVPAGAVQASTELTVEKQPPGSIERVDGLRVVGAWKITANPPIALNLAASVTHARDGRPVLEFRVQDDEGPLPMGWMPLRDRNRGGDPVRAHVSYLPPFNQRPPRRNYTYVCLVSRKKNE